MASSHDRAERLLDAQIAFLADQLGPASFGALLEQELDALLANAAELTLGDVVTREQITAVAIKYAGTFEIPGSIPELASEIAERVYRHPAQEGNRLQDVIAVRHVKAFTAKLLELPLVQERLIESPFMVEIVAEWLYRLGTDAAAQNRELAGRIPGLSTLLGAGGSLLGAVAPDAATDVNVRLRELSEQTARILLRRAKGTANSADDPWVNDTVVEMWHEQADKPVSSLQQYVTQEDLEDLIVLLYEFWLSFRETAYLHALIGEGVDFFFDKYAEASLATLLEEFGISRADLAEEAQRFAPPIIALLRANGMLEAFLRRRLEPFFQAESTRALLAETDAPEA